MTQGRHERVRPVTGILVGVVAVAIVVIAGIIAFRAGQEPDARDEQGDTSGVLLDEDFSQVHERWSPDSYAGITSEITGGAYRVSLARRDQSWREATGFEGAIEHESITVAARVVVQEPTQGARIGLTCESNPGDQDDITGLFGHYEGVVGLDGRARIVRKLNDEEEVLTTVDRQLDLPQDRPIDLEMTCTYVDDETEILFDVNGSRVAEAVERGPLAGFEGAGMSAAATAPGLEVAFERLEAFVRED